MSDCSPNAWKIPQMTPEESRREERQDFMVSLQASKGGNLITQMIFEDTYYDDVFDMVLNNELNCTDWGFAVIWSKNVRGEFLVDLVSFTNDETGIHASSEYL